MLKIIRKWLEPPIFSGEKERNEQARILFAIEHYLFLLLVVSAVAVPFLTPPEETNAALGIILGLLILTGISRLLLLRGLIEVSSFVLPISLWAVAISVAAFGGGVSSPMMFAAVIIAIVFGLLLKQLVGKILIGMSILAGLLMVILPEYGVILPQRFQFSKMDAWFVLLLCMVFSGLVVNYTLLRLDSALKQSRQQTNETMVKSEAMFRTMFDYINDGMIFSDAEGLISFRSPTYYRIDGYSNAEWGKLKHFEQIHPEDQELIQRSWQAVLQNSVEPARLEYRLRHKNGTWVWVETVLQNLLNDPDIQSVVLTTHSINERKQSEEALRRSESKFRIVIENSHDGVLFLDASNNIIYRSPSYVQLNGYTDEERLGRNGFDIVHPDDLEMLTQFWKEVKQTPGSSGVVEYRTRHKNGAWIWVESTLNNLLDDPDVGAVVLHSRDITEKKYLEQVRMESYAKMEKLFEILPVGISVLDSQRTIVKQNQALEKILQLDRRGLAQGKHMDRKYIRPDGTPMPEREFASSQVLQGVPSALNVETGVIKEDGEIIWLNVSATRVPFSDWHMVVVTSDITERKQAELKLRESEERFRSLIEQSSEGIVLTDESGTIIEWNRAQARMTGIPQDQAIGLPVWDIQYQLMLPERRSQLSPEMIKAGMQSVFSTGTSPYMNKDVEYEIRVAGELRSFLQISFPIKTEKGFRLGNITRDVTESKRAEASIRQHDADVLYSALEERQRLARELHDSVGQVLGYVSFQTEAARELYANGQAAEADAQLMRLASIAQDAHADVREYILNLRAAPTAREPLFKTLQNYLDGFTRNYNIRTSLIIGEGLNESTVAVKAQLSLFRIAQEALSNVRKHADARQVVLAFEMAGENVRMSIQDDGRGLDMRNLQNDNRPHFGLSFMNERVVQLGGSIHLEAAHPSGTRVLVEIPIQKEEAS